MVINNCTTVICISDRETTSRSSKKLYPLINVPKKWTVNPLYIL